MIFYLKMEFTKRELEYLKEFENNFNTAINHQYTRNIASKQLDELISIYKRVTDNPNFKICKHCSSNILSFIKMLGKMYFEQIEIKETNKVKNGKTRKSK